MPIPKWIVLSRCSEKWMRHRNKSIANDNKVHLKESYERLSRVYETVGNSSMALKNYRSFIAIKDSVFSAESSQKLTQVQMEFEFDKKIAIKEQQRKEAEQKEKERQLAI